MSPKAAVSAKIAPVWEPAWIPKSPEIAEVFEEFKKTFQGQEQQDMDNQEPTFFLRPTPKAARGNGIKCKFLSPEQAKKKYERSLARIQAFRKTLKVPDPENVVRNAFVEMLKRNKAEANRLLGNPITVVQLRSKHSSRVQGQDFGRFWFLSEYDLFEKQRKGRIVGHKPTRSRGNMNPLAGYEFDEATDREFREFLAFREREIVKNIKEGIKERMARERADPIRQSPKVQALFGTYVTTIVKLMQEGSFAAFKYCPSPASSADKATGHGKEGVATAILRALGFPGPELDPVSKSAPCAHVSQACPAFPTLLACSKCFNHHHF